MPTWINICKVCGQEFLARRRTTSSCSSACSREKERTGSLLRRDKFSPARRRAYVIVHDALNRGELIRQPCEVCGSRQHIRAHHDDYARPLEVRWLCTSHHKQHHNQHGPGLNAFCEEVST